MKILIPIFLILVVGTVPAFASQYPAVDPVREYYDERNRIAALEYADGLPIPKEYPTLFIELPEKIVCDNWIPVHGNVPEKGLLIWTILSGDYMQYVNVSHNPQFSLLNYFYLPCEGVESHAQINVTFMYGDLPNREPYDAVEEESHIKGLAIDRHYLFVQESFEVTK